MKDVAETLGVTRSNLSERRAKPARLLGHVDGLGAVTALALSKSDLR
jgi:hypothetical protein